MVEYYKTMRTKMGCPVCGGIGEENNYDASVCCKNLNCEFEAGTKEQWETLSNQRQLLNRIVSEGFETQGGSLTVIAGLLVERIKEVVRK